MKLDELRTVQSKERRKDSLQQLRNSFYRDVAAYIQDLKATRDRRAEQVDDPFSDNEVRRLSDELETAEEVAEAVYERRVGKVVKLASFAAADMPVDDEGMTGEERELFDDLVDRITQNKQAVLDVLSGTAEPTDNPEPVDTAPEPSTAGPTNPVDAASQPDAPSAGQPDGPATSQSAEPTTDAHAESTPGESDSVLAEAMGTESSGHSPAADTAPPAEPDTERESTEPATPTEVPPSEAEPEPDAVLGTSTDGGTTAESTDERKHGSGTTNPAAPTADGTTEPVESVDATEPAVDATEPADATESADDDSERTTLRITKNVGEIFGVDGREYTLRSEDVVTLPTANAEPLVERDAALQLD